MKAPVNAALHREPAKLRTVDVAVADIATIAFGDRGCDDDRLACFVAATEWVRANPGSQIDVGNPLVARVVAMAIGLDGSTSGDELRRAVAADIPAKRRAAFVERCIREAALTGEAR